MRVFVLRARSAPTDGAQLLAAVGKEAHTEILAHTLMNAIFVAQSHRPDVVVHLVLESTPDYSRAIRFDANAMRDIGGFHDGDVADPAFHEARYVRVRSRDAPGQAGRGGVERELPAYLPRQVVVPVDQREAAEHGAREGDGEG